MRGILKGNHMCKVVNLYKEPYDIYIGRAGRGQSGYFGNPIPKNKRCPSCDTIHEGGGSTLECYKKYLNQRIEKDEEFKKNVKNLKGKTLGCFCKPKPCHGDILAEMCLSLWKI
jgi:hypothetical protein